jgi:iron complex transport system substrate-binding protein
MRFIFLFFVLLISFSCAHDQNAELPENSISDYAITDSEFANYFTYLKTIHIKQLDGYKIVTLSNPWDSSATWQSYLLYPRGSEVDKSWPKTNAQIAVPVQSIVVTSASSIGFLDALDALDAVKGISKRKYVFSNAIRKGVDENRIIEIGEGQLVNYEQLIASQPELYLQTPYDQETDNDKIVRDAGIPVVYVADWLETSPLGRAEWVKFVALFIDKEGLANEVFNQIEQEYLALRKSTLSMDNSADVIVGTPFKDVWYMPAGESYKAILMRDAGINYHWASTEGKGSLPLGFETVLKEQFNAEFWIEVPFISYSSMRELDSKYQYFGAFKNQHIYHHQKLMHSDGANNYWERGVCRPNEILSDLIQMVHFPEDCDSLIFYQKLIP